MTTQRGYRRLPRPAILVCNQPLPVGHPVDLTHCSPPPTTTTKSKLDPPLAQHSLHQLRMPGSNLGRTTRRRGHGGRPRRPRAIPAMWLPANTTPATSFPLDTADAATHGHRTPDAGGQTVDTWTLRRPHRTPVTWTGPVDHQTLASDTGHQLPDTNADTVTTAQLVSGPPWPPRERPHAETPNRACALARPAGCSAAPRPSRAPAHCSPRTITGRAQSGRLSVIILWGRPRGVSSQAPELRERKIGITPFDCPCDKCYGELA
jgi:hypothetical protein